MQQEVSPKSKGTFLIGKEAEAKLLEMGFTKEQIAQKQQESLNKRQKDRATSDVKGNLTQLNHSNEEDKVVQQEALPKSKGIFLVGKEAEAKLLEMGFTKEQIAQKRQESLNKRQEERVTSGLGGSSESLNCNAGHGAISVFVADGSFFAYFVTTNAAAANPLSSACDDCLVYHQIFGESGISVFRHDVSAPWANVWWAWCT